MGSGGEAGNGWVTRRLGMCGTQHTEEQPLQLPSAARNESISTANISQVTSPSCTSKRYYALWYEIPVQVPFLLSDIYDCCYDHTLQHVSTLRETPRPHEALDLCFEIPAKWSDIPTCGICRARWQYVDRTVGTVSQSIFLDSLILTRFP